MQASDAITKAANSSTHADQVGSDSKPITWKPFAQLGDLRKRLSLNGIKHDQSHAGQESEGLESDQAEGVGIAV